MGFGAGKRAEGSWEEKRMCQEWGWKDHQKMGALCVGCKVLRASVGTNLGGRSKCRVCVTVVPLSSQDLKGCL